MKHSILVARAMAIQLLLSILTCAFTAQIAFGQGTAFTYQGRLTDRGNPANGSYDLQLSIYNAPLGGTLLGGPVTNSPTAVRDGLFSIQLDFGSSIFTGAERWLEIAARTNGGGAFILLAPRQQISAAPYAMTAREVTGDVSAEQLIGTIRSANIGAGTIHSNHLASGNIHSNHLALASIHSNHVAIGGIHSNHLALGSIHSNHLALGSIHSNHLALASIHSNHLAVGIIHSNHLAAGIIHSNALALGSVTAAALANGSIHSNHLAVGSVHSNALAIGGIHSNHLAIGSIHSNHLALATIHSNHLAVGSIHSNHLAVASIHSNHLAAGSIHSNALAIGSIHSNHLAVASIHSNHLAVGSVHSNALALGSVTASALVNGSIHSNHLAAGSVHSNALVLGSIHSNHLAIGAIHSNHLAVGSVHSNALAPGSVTAGALANDSIHSNHLAVGSIHSNALAIGSIHSNHLVIGSIHSNHLAAGSVHSNALALSSVTASALAIGSIHSNHLTAGAVSLNNLNTAVSSSSALPLSNPAPAFFTYFGTAVAAVGTDKVLIGAYQDSSAADNGGAAYLVHTNGALVRTFLSLSPQNQEHFGFSVAALGQDRVLIGADGNDTGAIDAGAAYLFSTNGTLLTALANPTPAASDFFGYAVATVGADKLLIGAYGDHFGSNVGGAVYLFATNGTLLTTLTNPTPAGDGGFDTAGGDRFGIAVAAVGTDYVLIGADRDNRGAIDAGVAYLFHVTGTLVTTITNPTPAMSDAFGSAVTAVGLNKVLIGAPADNSNGNAGGAAYLFDTNGTLLTTFTNPTPLGGDQFGIAVAAMGEDKVLIAAASDDNGATDAGVVYLFSTSGTLLTTFNNPAPANGDKFGNAVTALGTGSIVVGAFQDDATPTDSGAAYLFNLNPYVPGLVLDPAERTWERAGAHATYNGGNVGIGTTSPQTPLHVLGNNSQLRLQDSVLGNHWNIYTESHPTAPDGNLLFVPGPGGVFGFIRKSDGNYFSGSDIRLKTDVTTLSGLLDRVLQLRPVSYRFKSAADSASPAIGLIAQEVESLFPEVVAEHNGMKALSYPELVPVTVGAIQELNKKLEQKETEIMDLKKAVAELKELVGKLAEQRNDDAP